MKGAAPFVLIVLTLVASEVSAQGTFRLGVNLDAAGAFVNIVNQTNRYGRAAGYDSLGWPTSDFDLVLLDGRPVAEWMGTIDDPEQYRVDYSGRYACGFTGLATVRATGTAVTVENVSYDATANTTSFDLVVGGYPGPNHGLVFLGFTDTRRSLGDTLRSGVTGLKVHRPGYPLSSTKVFTDEYISLCKAADFACYRFYNLQNIWEGEPPYPQKNRWEGRKTPQDAAQVSMAATSGKREGWCWEYIVALSNILKRDIWICLHISCDSQYVAALAGYLKDSLDPSVNLYIESSNEVWSPTQATHGPYNQADAQARGITFDQNHARRTVELARWFAAVFGRNEINRRIRVILAGQHAYHGRSDNHLAYIRDTFGEPKQYVYATSTALYFGSTKASASDPAMINEGMLEEIADQITDPQSGTYRMNHLAKASAWDLPGGCTSYEGGPHLPAGGGTTNLGNQIRAHRTAAMGEAIKRNFIEGWKHLGGGLAMYFTLTSGYNRYGCWGITDDVTRPDRNEKMRALREIISGTTGAREPPQPDSPVMAAYPNPCRTLLILRSAGRADARITDLLGREVWRGRVEGAEAVDVSGLRKGIYLLLTKEKVMKLVHH